MQKKELRKSWRRKLAGLLAGTLIAGVFGISMPMTAKAAGSSISGAVAFGNVAIDDLQHDRLTTEQKTKEVTVTVGEHTPTSGTPTNDTVTIGEATLSANIEDYFTYTAGSTKEFNSEGTYTFTLAPNPDANWAVSSTAISGTLTINFTTDDGSGQPTGSANIPVSLTVVAATDNSVVITTPSVDDGTAQDGKSGSYDLNARAGKAVQGVYDRDDYLLNIVLRNDGNSNVSLASATFANGNSSKFTTDIVATVIESKKTAPFTIAPAASLEAGTYSDTLTLTDTAGNSIAINVTFKVDAKDGSFVAERETPATTPATYEEISSINFNQDGVEYVEGDQTWQNKAVVTFRVRNTGNYKFEVSQKANTKLEHFNVSITGSAMDAPDAGGKNAGTMTVNVTPSNDADSIKYGTNGRYSETLTLVSPDGKEKNITLSYTLAKATSNIEITDNNNPSATALSGTLKFNPATKKGDVINVDGNEKTLYLRNVGNSEGTLKAEVTASKNGLFAVTGTNTDPLAMPVKNGNITTYTYHGPITITPVPSKLQAGSNTDTVEFETDRGEKASLTLSINVEEEKQEINVPVTSLTFDAAAKGYQVGAKQDVEPKTLKIENKGNVTATNVKVDMSQAANFLLDNGSVSKTVQVPVAGTPLTFQPKTDLEPNANGTDRTYTGKVTISRGSEESFTVDLSFTVKANTYTLAQTAGGATLNFGKVARDGEVPEEQTITIKNNGNTTATLKTAAAVKNYDIKVKPENATTKFDAWSVLNNNVIDPGKEITLAIRPKQALLGTVKNYDEKITFTTAASEDPKQKVEINAKFEVEKATFTMAAFDEDGKEVTVVDFGELPLGFTTSGEGAEKTLTIKNTGNSETTLLKPATVPRGFDVTGIDANKPLKPGAEEEGVTIKITPTSEDATQTVEQKLTLTNSNSEKVELTLKYSVAAAKYSIAVTPETLTFDDAEEGYTPAKKTLKVENTGNSKITITVPTDEKFDIEADTTELERGASATVTVSPKKDLKAGEHKATLTFATDKDASASANVSFKVSKKNGWIKEDGKWFFYKDGAAAKGWLKDGGKWYFLDKSTGLMKTGWLQDDGKWYYLADSGAMKANAWQKSGNSWYYMTASGAMATSKWISHKGDWYYIKANGVMATNAWQKSGGKWYYLGADGVMVKSTSVTVKGKKYNFDKNGVCTNP